MSENNTILTRRAFLGMATTIALPIMVQNLISTLVSTADTLMLGYVSQAAMSASSLANNYYLVLWCAIYSFCTGAQVLGSQYWGKGDTKTIERVLGITIRFCLATSFVFWALAFFFPGAVMTVFTNDPEIIAQGMVYLRIVSFSFIFGSFSMGYFSILRSMEKVVLPSVVFVVSLVINISLNATFIFGIGGAPKLGLAGVAVGTVAARVFEAITCIVHSLVNREVKIRIGLIFNRAGVLMNDFLKLSLPSLVNDVAWSTAAAVFSAILGHLGNDTVAAHAVTAMAVNIGAIVSRGFANATTIVVGKALGENNIEKGKIYARRMVVLTAFFSIIGGCVIVAIRPLLIFIYTDKLTAASIGLLSGMLVMQAVRLLGEGLNTCWICGCFRGGGDAKFGMIVDTFSMWCMAVPLMAIAAYVFKLPILVVYFVMCLDEFEKMPFVIHHYRKFTWLRNITRDEAELN